MKRLLLLALICGVLKIHGQPSPEDAWPSAAPVYRYLFVVDTSSAMSRQKDVAIDTVHKLVLSGIGGRAQVGDVIGIWTFNEQIDTNGFPARMWAPRNGAEFANLAYRHLRDQKFSGKAGSDAVSAAISAAAQKSGSLTVFWFTDGSTPVKGTPFDAPVNEIFQNHAAKMRKDKLPFVLVMVARNGAFVAHSVSSGGGTIYLPTVPTNETNPPPSVARTPPKSSADPRRSRPRPTESGGSSPTNAVRSLSVAEIEQRLKESLRQRTNVLASESRPTGSPAPAVNSPASDASAPAPATEAPKPLPEAPKPAVAPEIPEPEKAAAPTPVRVLEKTEKAGGSVVDPVSSATAPNEGTPSTKAPEPPSKQEEGLNSQKPGPPPDSLKEPGPQKELSPAPQQTAIVVPPVSSERPRSFLWPGALLLGAVGAAGWIFIRRWRLGGRSSLISRSMDNRRP
jgi:hypothetical protein